VYRSGYYNIILRKLTVRLTFLFLRLSSYVSGFAYSAGEWPCKPDFSMCLGWDMNPGSTEGSWRLNQVFSRDLWRHCGTHKDQIVYLAMQLKVTAVDKTATLVVDSSVMTFICRLNVVQTRLRFGPPLTSNATSPSPGSFMIFAHHLHIYLFWSNGCAPTPFHVHCHLAAINVCACA
jgi:hypothetical protein